MVIVSRNLHVLVSFNFGSEEQKYGSTEILQRHPCLTPVEVGKFNCFANHVWLDLFNNYQDQDNSKNFLLLDVIYLRVELPRIFHVNIEPFILKFMIFMAQNKTTRWKFLKTVFDSLQI